MNKIISKPIIPIFFAIDNNYAPFFSVALESIKANSSKNYQYEIHILNNDLCEDYKKILLESNLSPIYIYGKLFEDLGVKFSYDDSLIDYICDEALALECGARGLKTIFDGMMSDYMFEVFAGVRKDVDLTAPKDNSHSYVLKKKAAQNRKKVGFSI